MVIAAGHYQTWIMEEIKSSCDRFASLTVNPLVFLSGESQISFLLSNISSSLYSISKSNSHSASDDPFSNLLTNGFDDEQVWQQIDVFNNQSIKNCTKGAALCLNNKVVLHADVSNNEEEIIESLSEENESKSASEDNDDQQSGVEADEIKKSAQDVFEKTAVDDDFFSLRQMEKFLLAQESVTTTKTDDDEIDYFNEIPFDDEDQDHLHEDIFTDDEEMGDVGSDAEVGSIEAFSDAKQSSRHLKYDQFFSDKNADPVSKKKTMTKLKKQQLAMSKKIEVLEEQALGEKEWQMQGETIASNRPVNSLLEEVLSFDYSQRPAPAITDEHTCNLEKIICQRIKDKSWDDVEKKIKEVKDPHSFKKNVILDSEKSKISLQEIYEKEYLAKLSQEQQEDKENPAHVELASLMKDLFKKLDALSNFHFHLPPPEPEIKVLTNLPSIAMEEVQPVTHTEADALAPEEIYHNQEEKADLEKSSTDRKRERRKKSAKQKVIVFLLS